MPFVMEAVAVDDDKNNKESNKSKSVPFGIKGFILEVKVVVFAYHFLGLVRVRLIGPFFGHIFIYKAGYILFLDHSVGLFVKCQPYSFEIARQGGIAGIIPA